MLLKHAYVIALSLAMAQGQQPQPAGRVVGVVQSVAGNAITLKTDEGQTVTVQVQEGGRVMRAGGTQSAVEKAELSDIQSGDRLLARGTSSGDGQFATTAVLLMKKSDLANKQQQELSAWTRGFSGVVTAVDPSTGDIKLRSGPTQTYTVHTSGNTEFLRYSPNSTRFADAGKSSLAQIKTGDQVRAKGNKTGDELAADAVISGTFRNIAATVSSVDADNNKLTVQDFVAKKPVEIKVNADSQMHALPAQMASRIAMMLKGGASGATVAQGGAPAVMAQGGQNPRPGGGPGAFPGGAPRPNGGGGGYGGQGGNFGGGPGGGQPDLQRFLSRTPALQLSDLKKGDAVLIVATENGTAVALISGVEPILTAAPGTEAVNLLSNWNLGAQGGEGGAQ